MKRAFVIVLDACGVGELPDAEAYGDRGANTLAHLASAVGGLRLPTLSRLGLGSILPLEGVTPAPQPVLHGRLHPLGPGKDSTAGHWELMGVVASSALPAYPEGLPAEVVDLVKAASGRGVICNSARNGIQAIEEFGARHLEGGELIVYTSQDSVLQIAAHVELIGPEELYAICRRVRASLPPQHAVGRVIARPFTGAAGSIPSHRWTSRLLHPPARPAATYKSSTTRVSRCTRWAKRASCSAGSASMSSIQGPPTRPRCATPPSWCEASAAASCSPT